MHLFRKGEDLKLLFNRFDTDDDGKLSWLEAWKAMEPLYDRLCDSKQYKFKVTQDCHQFEATCREMFKDADENQDGELSLDEFKQFTLNLLQALEGLNFRDHDLAMANLFAEFDRNKDGVLSWDEVWRPLISIKAKV